MTKRLVLIFLIMVVLSSCGSKSNLDTTASFESTEETTEIEIGNETEKETETKIEPKEGIPSPLSGIYYEEEIVKLRPVAVMFDNHPSARWQAGITKAEVVYEIEVEGPYTRYLAIYLCEAPEQIGPVRSARPYFIRFALEYDPVYVHVGGSMEAMANIVDYNMADLDGLYSGEFWRYYDTGKKAPNNMYIAMKNIRNAQEYKNYRSEGKYEGFIFSEDTYDLTENEKNSQVCNSLSIVYNSEYFVNYEFESEKGKYARYVNGKLQKDEYYKDSVVATNIIIQKTQKKVLDNEGRLHISNVSEGTGNFITNGKAIDITWEKTSYNSRTIYKDLNGNEIILNPGQTWIQVVTQSTNIEIKE
jgi:hypothetical protein